MVSRRDDPFSFFRALARLAGPDDVDVDVDVSPFVHSFSSFCSFPSFPRRLCCGRGHGRGESNDESNEETIVILFVDCRCNCSCPTAGFGIYNIGILCCIQFLH